MTVREQALCAKAAAPALAGLSTEKKNRILLDIAARLRRETDSILKANAADLKQAEEAGLRPALLDRLRLTAERIEGMAVGAEQVAALPDPVGEVLADYENADGLRIKKVRVPFGVCAMIFEARPNVAVDSALLGLKSGNAVILRGGREAYQTNLALAELMRTVLAEAGLPRDLICLISDLSHEGAEELMTMKGTVDLLIPRGGKNLIRAVMEKATVPVIETGTGICHVYVDKAADAEMAEAIIVNAKVSRPSVCNAAETLLVHRDIAASFLPRAGKALAEKGVSFRADERALAYLPCAEQAGADAFDTEYNDLILNVAVVDDLDAALAHIAAHGTRHSECIVTADKAAAERFLTCVDAAAVYHNASTRFTDGFVFGLGAEIGISTQKLHARGPMGLCELTTYQYRIEGTGQTR